MRQSNEPSGRQVRQPHGEVTGLSDTVSPREPLADHRVTLTFREKRCQRILRITGWVLICASLATGAGSLVYTVLRYSVFDFWWLTSVLVLLFAFQNDPMRRVGRAVGTLMLILWMCLRFNHLDWIPPYIASRIGDDCLTFMLMILGVLILSTNDPHDQTRLFFQRWSSKVRMHRLKSLAVCVAILWVVDVDNTHDVCLVASDVCLEFGEYDSAIALTKFARDAFPPRSIDWPPNLSDRIWRLRRQRHAAENERRNKLDVPSDALPTMNAR